MGKLAAELLAELSGKAEGRAAVLALSGHLGAGKTALVQEIAEALGVAEHVTSPTFVLMKSYKTTHATLDTLVHVDAYRLSSEAELTRLGFREYLSRPKTLICIEWPERVPALIPEDAVRLSLEATSPESRYVTRL